MASAVNLLGSSSNTTGTGSSSSSSTPMPATEQTFLTLLVSQLQNQDPLNPTDSTQFVSQLAQFSELEQVMGIRQDIESYHDAATSATNNNSSTGTGNNNGTTPTSS